MTGRYLEKLDEECASSWAQATRFSEGDPDSETEAEGDISSLCGEDGLAAIEVFISACCRGVDGEFEETGVGEAGGLERSSKTSMAPGLLGAEAISCDEGPSAESGRVVGDVERDLEGDPEASSLAHGRCAMTRRTGEQSYVNSIFEGQSMPSLHKIARSSIVIAASVSSSWCNYKPIS